MRVSQVMTTNVVSIPSDTSLAQARRIMDVHKFKRLPVIDRGKLVGIVSRSTLDKVGPSQITTFSVHELGYLLSTIQVKTVMHREVITVHPDVFINDAIALAQSKGVGLLVVMEADKVIGVLATNEVFHKVINPILGVNVPSTRIYIQNCSQASDIEAVMAVFKSLNIEIIGAFVMNIPEIDNTHDFVVNFNSENSSKCITEIQTLGYRVVEKPR